MALHALKDGTAANVEELSKGSSVFRASLKTPLTEQQYGAMLAFIERCENPAWSVSQKSALAQVSLDVRVSDYRNFQSLKYRKGMLSVPATIALESVYARRHFRDVLPQTIKGWDIGRVFAYDRAEALDINEITDLYHLPKGTKVLGDHEIGLPMEDLHYVIKENELQDPSEALIHALIDGRRGLKNVLAVRHGPLPAIAPRDTLISAFTLESKMDRVPPTNVVLGIRTTRAKIEHLHAPLLDEGRKDGHHESSDQHSMCFQVELVNRGNQVLDPQQVKETLVTARFYRTVDGVELHHGAEVQEGAFA